MKALANPNNLVRRLSAVFVVFKSSVCTELIKREDPQSWLYSAFFIFFFLPVFPERFCQPSSPWNSAAWEFSRKANWKSAFGKNLFKTQLES